MKSCEICTILKTHNNDEDIEIIETTKWRVVLDPNQRTLGKSFVTLLEHKSSLSELNQEDWDDFAKLTKHLESAISKSYKPNHFNWSCLMNIAAINNQPTHVHWHIQPRYNRSITINNEIFHDTQWYPQSNKIDNKVSRDTLQVIADHIKAHL